MGKFCRLLHENEEILSCGWLRFCSFSQPIYQKVIMSMRYMYTLLFWCRVLRAWYKNPVLESHGIFRNFKDSWNNYGFLDGNIRENTADSMKTNLHGSQKLLPLLHTISRIQSTWASASSNLASEIGTVSQFANKLKILGSVQTPYFSRAESNSTN